MATDDPSAGDAPRHVTLLLCLLAAIVILTYHQTLTFPFILDDIHNIRDNAHIRLPSLSFEDLARAGLQSPSVNRPVANISFALNYYLHDYNPVGYHALNILIHITSGIFLYFLVQATLQTPVLRERYAGFGWIPFFTALIWLVHPLQTQSVTYIVQRMNSLAAMFYVLSMLLYVKFRLSTGRRPKWALMGGCVLAGMLALGTKEISASLPAFIVLYEWYFFQGLDRQWTKRQILVLAGCGAFIILISFVYFGSGLFANILDGYANRDFTLAQRVLTQFRVVIFYISLLLWPQPTRLNLDHDIALSYSPVDPVTTLLSMIVIIVLILMAILSAKREPLISFCIFWYFGNLLIESSIIGLELIFEHRNYLPSMLAILPAIVLVFRYSKPAWLGVVVLCVVGALFTGWTFERNKDWSDEITLYRDSVEKAPGKARPYNNLGAALVRVGNLAAAVEQLRNAVKIKPDYVDAHYNLGYALSRQGNLDAGIYHFDETLRLDPNNLKALNNMGTALALQGRYGEAAHYYETALKHKPGDAALRHNLEVVLRKQAKVDQAAHLKIEVGGQMTEGRGQRAEGRGQRAEGWGQGAEGRGQRAEGWGQRTDDRRQRTDDR